MTWSSWLAVSQEKELLQHRAEGRENNQKAAWHENCSLRQGGGGETGPCLLGDMPTVGLEVRGPL